MKIKGLHTYRFEDNPEELRFAEAWAKFAPPHLKHLLAVGGDCRFPPDPSERDEQVAATVVQWLGSPVGQGFLSDLGYTKDPPP